MGQENHRFGRDDHGHNGLIYIDIKIFYRETDQMARGLLVFHVKIMNLFLLRQLQ